MTLRVWIQHYEPFQFGGDVHRPVCCDLEVGEPSDLGGGYEGYLIALPNGKTAVVESLSGGVVGLTIEEVRNDIAAGDGPTMAAQVAAAVNEGKRARLIDKQKFMSLLEVLR